MADSPTPKQGLGIRPDAPLPASQQWFARAQKALAGGISSSARFTTAGRRPFPLYMTRGQGAHLWDADGDEFIDYLLSFGSCILGHAHPELVSALHRQLDAGTMFGTCNTPEVELAERIATMVPNAHLVRYANSGSEAMLGAIRAARGYTGKTKLLKFEGHYHGWVDLVAVSTRPDARDAGPLEAPHSVPHTRGIPAYDVADVIICPWNHPKILREILDRYDGQFAAVIAEPIVANNACIMPDPGYLELLREECTRRGIVLIFDEIVTAFRTRPGGAQELFGVNADLIVLSKALGGGLPISAFGGITPIMKLVAENRVKHGGTYNGNPLCATAAGQTLRILSDPAQQTRMETMGQRLMEAIRRAAHDRGIKVCVQGPGPMFQVVFNADGRAPRHYRDMFEANGARYTAFQSALLDLGVVITASHMACWFLSTAHSDDDVQRTCKAIDVAMRSVQIALPPMLKRLVDAIAHRVPPHKLAAMYKRIPPGVHRRMSAQRFRQTVRYVAKHSPYYRRRFAELGIKASQVRTPADLGDFFTTPADIVANPSEFLCRPPSIVFESSGTSGKNKQVYYGRDELAALGLAQAVGLRMMGVAPDDRVANAFDFSMWIPGMMTHYGLMQAGNFCMAFGKVDPIEVYRRLEQYRFNIIMGEPTWLIRLTELAEKHGTFPLKRLIGGAEEMPADAIPWMQRVWAPAQVKMCYGSVELGSALGFQPCDNHDGYHLDVMDFYPELVDPDEQGYGEVVFTTLTRLTMPLLRYRSRDVSRFETAACPCGLHTPRMARLRGRRDEMVVASGGNLYPLLFENCLSAVPGLTHDWQVIFKLQGVREVMEIHVESTTTDAAALLAQVQAEMTRQYPDLIKNLNLGIFSMVLTVHAPGTLRAGRKLKRLIDLRHAPATP